MSFDITKEKVFKELVCVRKIGQVTAEEELKLAEKHFGVEIYRPKSIDMFNELDNVAALISQLDFVVGPSLQYFPWQALSARNVLD